ncbi:MAG: NADH-quinone oxidoreductase subunit C [Candidatus Wallbacteria bacterium]|nr:NADH-quinone oxidoreductase subunit C [Candidatus Wallbacteria bacterium]
MESQESFAKSIGKTSTEALGAAIAVERVGPHQLRIGPVSAGYEKLVPALVGLGGRMASLVATDERGRLGGFCLRAIVVFDRAGWTVEVQQQCPSAKPVLQSIAARVPAAHWQEREVAEMMGFTLLNHPEPYRRLLHAHTPVDSPRLRKDFDGTVRPPFVAGPPPAFRPVRGEGVHEVPVGPIHAGIIEPGHFRFFVLGERILHLQMRLGYQHKGTEKLFEGQSPAMGVHLAESVSGDTSFGHALAYCLALERLSGTSVPSRAVHLRALALELERLANHVGDLGGLCADIGHQFGASHFARLRGEFLNKCELLSGSRYLRGFCCPGGVRCDLEPAMAKELIAWLPGVRADLTEVCETVLEADSVAARMEQVGVLGAQAVRDLGIVGPAARASGVSIDVRHDFPTGPCRELGFEPIVETQGDVQARARVRSREASQSLDLVEVMLTFLPGGAILQPLERPRPFEFGIGQVEGWRGEILTCVLTDDEGLLWRVRVRDPSVQNWLGLALAVEMNLVSDFPLCNKSFNLSYSGSDL